LDRQRENDEKDRAFPPPTPGTDSQRWKNPIDLGDITTARGSEMYIALWMRLMGLPGTAQFNFKIVK
jgi:hypothetical protein